MNAPEHFGGDVDALRLLDQAADCLPNAFVGGEAFHGEPGSFHELLCLEGVLGRISGGGDGSMVETVRASAVATTRAAADDVTSSNS